MQRRSVGLGFALVTTLVWSTVAPGDAVANPKVVREVRLKNKQAMESYDLLEYERALGLLKDAISLARKRDVKNRDVADSFVNLAIVLYSGLQDVENARLALIEAVKIDEDVDIGRAYRTKELSRLLSEARREFGGSTSRSKCEEVEGIAHLRLETAQAGSSRILEAQLGPNLKGRTLHLHYRSEETKEFTKAEMTSSGGCSYVGSLPEDAMNGEVVHYFLQATDAKGRVIANRGSETSPYIVELEGGGALASDEENPLLARKRARAKRAERARFLVLLSGGTGGGIVTGATEQMRADVGCCVGASLLHASPEIAYLVRPNVALGAALRVSFPLGANIPGHATDAFSGFLRLRYAFSKNMEGLQAVGSLGGGIFRNTVKLNEAAPGMDVDTSASGPFLIGPGLAYFYPVGSGVLKLVGEVHTLVAFSAGIEELNGIRMGFGVQLDVSIGAAISW